MFDELLEYAIIYERGGSMERIENLYKDLKLNALMIEQTKNNIQEAEQAGSNPDQLESLYKNEFVLHMDNIGIYEDLQKAIKETPKTTETALSLARIKRDSADLVKVAVVEVK